MQRQRLFDTLEELAACTATPGAGVTRPSWSAADRQARQVLVRELHAIGIEPRADGMGNLHARRKGVTDAPAVLLGSHLDTVPHGGRLDGAYGVAAALEVLRSFHDQGFVPLCDVECIAFAEEEGSNFGLTCLGSKAITGHMDVPGLRALRNAEGSALSLLQNAGLHPESLPQEQINPQRVRAFLEVHIEQNSSLERAGTPLGIVTAIAGMRLYRLTFRGRADHAASPMQGRRDPVAGFAAFAHAMEELWRTGELPEDFSCTTGMVSSRPGVGIAIAESIVFTIDIRHVNLSALDEGWKRIERLARALAGERGLEVDIAPLSASGGVRMDSEVNAVLLRAAQGCGVNPLFLTSGPAHDAAPMGTRVPAGLLFVPSIDGLSHCPQEDTAPEHLALGAQVLEDAVRMLAGGSVADAR